MIIIKYQGNLQQYKNLYLSLYNDFLKKTLLAIFEANFKKNTFQPISNRFFKPIPTVFNCFKRAI
jgi:hypothetical protein